MSEVTITRAPATGMVSLRADLTNGVLQSTVMNLTGTRFPDQCEILHNGEHSVAWMAPDEVLLLLPHAGVQSAIAQMSQSLADVPHLAAEVSDARTLFQLSGPGVREVLAKGAPIDLLPTAFQPGHIRRTRLGQVAAALWMVDADSFRLICFRSVTEYVDTFLATASQPGSLPNYF